MRGWFGDREQHSLASKGIKTKYISYGKMKKSYAEMDINERVKYLHDTSFEWLSKYEETHPNPAEVEYVKSIYELTIAILDRTMSDEDNPLFYSQNELDEEYMAVKIEHEKKGGMVKIDGEWYIDTEPMEFGSVIWQNSMIYNIGLKISKDINLDTSDKIFLEIQKEHLIRELKEKRENGTIENMEDIVLSTWEAEEL